MKKFFYDWGPLLILLGFCCVVVFFDIPYNREAGIFSVVGANFFYMVFLFHGKQERKKLAQQKK